MARIKKLFSIGTMFMLIMVMSCSDNDSDQNPNPNLGDCRVVTYRCESRNETWKIVYNSSGLYDSILIGDQQNVDMIKTFDYVFDNANDKVEITVDRFYLGNPSDGPSYVESDALGKILSIRDERYDQEDYWEMVGFTYRSDEPTLIAQSQEAIYGSNESYESYYQWELETTVPAINMIELVTPSGVYTYGYYDLPTQPGDYLNFEKVIAAYDKYYRPFSSSHLLKWIELDGEPLVDVTYTFDSEGKITSFTADYDGGAPEKWDITYECK